MRGAMERGFEASQARQPNLRFIRYILMPMREMRIICRAAGALLLGAVFAGSQPPELPVGLFQSHGDIGETPKTGTTEFSGGEYRVTGGGANIWAAQDAFQFAWKKMSGDISLSADVHFIGTGAVAHRKAVLMIRQDLSPNSPYIDVALHGDGLTSLQYREEPGGQTKEIRSALNGPAHLHIERHGDAFTVSARKDGGENISTGPQTLKLKDPVYVGIGISSHDVNVLETAVFSNLQLLVPGSQISRQYRSRVTIFDLTTRQNRTVYEADHIVEAPNWSRNGKYLMVNTQGNLYRLPLAGEPKLEKIELAGHLRCNNDHDLSKNGKRLAFSASSSQSRQSQVYVANADGSDVKMRDATAPSYFHGWSPDGKWLAIVGQRNGAFHLFRVPAQGGTEQALTSQGPYDDGSEYTPDGKWIYFNSERSGGWDIWRMPPDGAGPDDKKAERVTSDDLEDWFPHFSPDGKKMIFLSFPAGTTTHNDKMDGVQLRMMPAPGKTLKPEKIEVLTTFYGGQGTINVNSWAPDSKRFAYVIYEPLK
jgi:TolB protein